MQQDIISVIGLGYVGLPLAVAFGQKYAIIGFDINTKRIADLKQGVDETDEADVEELKKANILYTADSCDIAKANFHIVTVPTPIDAAKNPDLQPLYSASEIVGKYLKKGDIVVYESTVYPGVTEDECAPILEQHSGLKCGVDFFVGYSPERINPGDKVHTFTKIKKVVSGQAPAVLEKVANLYGDVVEAGIHKTSSIKAAEAAKVIENTQRDLNIALINELALIFDRMGIDTLEVLEAAGTKWNFLPFRPGLVGGHCIGVDPYYLTHKAEMLGIHPQVILAGRRINDGMGKFIAEQTVKMMIHAAKQIKAAKVGVLGLTFKENCPDIRNTRVVDIILELQDFGVEVLVHDPIADAEKALDEYGVSLTGWDSLQDLDAIILAVPHEFYCDLDLSQLLVKCSAQKILIDVKSILDQKALAQLNTVSYWRL
jgi:UDP-N-acetyl-D-glucosamine/UDP-N-acetyl-D-galactosamine dehydrogenase